jgi:4-hydroxythreonine-4-phosphate dehydrogenase
MSKPKIGITIGDVNGIGPEVIIKSLIHESSLKQFIPIIYASSKVLAYHKNIVEDKKFTFTTINSPDKASYNRVNVINCWEDTVNITLSRATEEGGKYALAALERASEDLQSGELDALVTAPINKQAMQMAGFEDVGHTEYLTRKVGGNSLMMMVSDDMKIALVTNHLPISKVAENITQELIEQKLQIFTHSLKVDFGIEKPIIAVLGLNPHAGDDGTIGSEDLEIIRPVIINAKKNGQMVVGPYAADGFFGSSQFVKVDGILAMYHDQGLIPFKALSFGSGVNFTAGLSVIRTSPDHGTAYDIAGKNEADHRSMQQALFLALNIIQIRHQHKEDHSNSISKGSLVSEENA